MVDDHNSIPCPTGDAAARADCLRPEGNINSSPIAICTVGELFGGVERHVLGMLEGLKAKGIEATLILFHDRELATQARLHGVSPVIMPSGNLTLLATARKLARYFCERQSRIVHVHGYKATVFCALARLWCSIALVRTEHGLPESMAGRPLRVLRDRAYHWLSTALARLAGARLCYVTHELRTHYQGAIPRKQSVVIPNGVMNLCSTDFDRSPAYAESCFNLAIVGRLDTVKGHNVAIEALAMQNVPANIHLHIIGTGPREAQLRALAQTANIGDRVHFLGFRRNVYDYIAHSDALLMPSLHEGLPYTLLEAMALGTPIVASNVGGMAEVLRDGENALLVPSGNPEALAAAVSRLHANQELRQCLGANGRRLQQERYSLAAMTDRYIEVYREAMENLRPEKNCSLKKAGRRLR